MSRSCRCRRISALALLGFLAILIGPAAVLGDDDGAPPESPPTAQDVRDLMEHVPLSDATWPKWRDYFVRLYFDYDVEEPKEFYERLRDFIGELATRHQGTLPDEWTGDAIAWTILAHYHMRRSEADRAVEADRKAVSLDAQSPIASLDLAICLIWRIRIASQGQSLNAEHEKQLVEVEALLARVAGSAPQARLTYWRGVIAMLRGQIPTAIPLLLQGTRDFPRRSHVAVDYLMTALGSNDTPQPLADVTAPFLERFPTDAYIRAFHAVALFRDARYPEAFESLEEARRQNPQVDGFIGKEGINAIEQAKGMTPLVVSGVKHLKEHSFDRAVADFREALEKDPQNVRIAQLLARSLVGNATSHRRRRDSILNQQALRECEKLSETFPDDASLHVGRALLLSQVGRSVEANEALDRAQSLGGKLDELADRRAISAIRDAARQETQLEQGKTALVVGLSVYAGWIVFMFAIGWLLSGMTRRAPDWSALADGPGTRETILKWVYLVVLSLGLVMFYISIPFVALGLLAVTAGLFGLFLVIRILHFGVLYRGFYATWGVISSAVVGTSQDVLGVEVSEADQPSLFAALQDVAMDLNTRPADHVYLTPVSSIGVRQEGRGPFGLFRRRRVMEIGLPTLSLLTVPEFKSVLAHEYAHFSQSDPFYSRFIFQVSVALHRSLAMMDAAGGVITKVNPFYWFYWLYLKAYLLLAAGFSRSREFLADRCAIQTYGKEAFVSSLTKVAVNDVVFVQTVVQKIHEHLARGEAFENMFSLFREYREHPQVIALSDQVLEAVRAEKGSMMDSHPTFPERIAASEWFEEPRTSPDLRPATELLTETDKLEEQLTHLLTRAMYDEQQMAAA
jgi:Zn-dependent protease with chaperone function/Flp pilus assembly protein TadD